METINPLYQNINFSNVISNINKNNNQLHTKFLSINESNLIKEIGKDAENRYKIYQKLKILIEQIKNHKQTSTNDVMQDLKNNLELNNMVKSSITENEQTQTVRRQIFTYLKQKHVINLIIHKNDQADNLTKDDSKNRNFYKYNVIFQYDSHEILNGKFDEDDVGLEFQQDSNQLNSLIDECKAMNYVKSIMQDQKDKHKPTVFLQYLIKCLLGNWVCKDLTEADCKSILTNLCHVMNVQDQDLIDANYKFEEQEDEDSEDQFITMEDLEKADREMKVRKEVDDDWGDIDMDEFDDMDLQLEMEDDDQN